MQAAPVVGFQGEGAGGIAPNIGRMPGIDKILSISSQRVGNEPGTHHLFWRLGYAFTAQKRLAALGKWLARAAGAGIQGFGHRTVIACYQAFSLLVFDGRYLYQRLDSAIKPVFSRPYGRFSGAAESHFVII